MELSVDIRRRTAQDLLAAAGPLAIRVVAGARTEADDVDRVIALADELLGHYPVVGMLVIVEHGSPIPDGEVRRHMRQAAAHLGQRAVVAFALEGLGFWASTALAVATGLMQFAGNSVMADTNLRVLLDRLALDLVGVDPQALFEICEGLRRELAGASASSQLFG